MNVKFNSLIFYHQWLIDNNTTVNKAFCMKEKLEFILKPHSYKNSTYLYIYKKLIQKTNFNLSFAWQQIKVTEVTVTAGSLCKPKYAGCKH